MPEIIIIPTMVIIFGWVIRSVLDHRLKTKLVQLQSDMQTRVLDRFSSAQEIAAYMDSAAGRKLLDVSYVEQASPYRRILSSMIAGIVLTAAGTGFLFLRNVFVSANDAQSAVVFGTIMTSLGLGFLVASVATYALSKNWGLINGQTQPSDQE